MIMEDLQQSQGQGGCIPYSQTHPKYLHTNSTSHKWPFSAVAELIDNAYDVCATKLDINYESFFSDHPCLTFTDNGNGVDAKGMHKMLSLGYSYKEDTPKHLPVGQYGNGFNSGSMRLGKDAIVFSKTRDTMTVGFLSQTYHENIKAETVLVPIVSWDRKHTQMLKSVDAELSLQAILTHSIFKTKDALFQQFEKMGRCKGTRIIISNLKRDSTNRLEFDFISDEHDIIITEECAAIHMHNTQERQDSDIPAHVYSLRAFCSILYKKPFLYINLRGRKVQTVFVEKSLSRTERDTYRPKNVERSSGKPVKITFGFNPKKNQYGIMMYHRNRLIKPYVKVGYQTKPDQRGVGVVGVVECNFLQPTHNKQDFTDDGVYRSLITALGSKLNYYWNEKMDVTDGEKDTSNTEKPEQDDEPDDNWVQCDRCRQWRKLPPGVNMKAVEGIEEWFCEMNPDPDHSQCTQEEEPEDTDVKPSYEKKNKRRKQAARASQMAIEEPHGRSKRLKMTEEKKDMAEAASGSQMQMEPNDTPEEIAEKVNEEEEEEEENLDALLEIMQKEAKEAAEKEIEEEKKKLQDERMKFEMEQKKCREAEKQRISEEKKLQEQRAELEKKQKLFENQKMQMVNARKMQAQSGSSKPPVSRIRNGISNSTANHSTPALGGGMAHSTMSSAGPLQRGSLRPSANGPIDPNQLLKIYEEKKKVEEEKKKIWEEKMKIEEEKKKLEEAMKKIEKAIKKKMDEEKKMEEEKKKMDEEKKKMEEEKKKMEEEKKKMEEEKKKMEKAKKKMEAEKKRIEEEKKRTEEEKKTTEEEKKKMEAEKKKMEEEKIRLEKMENKLKEDAKQMEVRLKISKKREQEASLQKMKKELALKQEVQQMEMDRLQKMIASQEEQVRVCNQQIEQAEHANCGQAGPSTQNDEMSVDTNAFHLQEQELPNVTWTSDKDLKDVVHELGPDELLKLYTALYILKKDVEKAQKSANTPDEDLKALEVLRQWRQKNGKNATKESILAALTEIEMLETKEKLERKWKMRHTMQ